MAYLGYIVKRFTIVYLVCKITNYLRDRKMDALFRCYYSLP